MDQGVLKISNAAERDTVILAGKIFLVQGIHQEIMKEAIRLNTKTVRHIRMLIEKYDIDERMLKEDQMTIKK